MTNEERISANNEELRECIAIAEGLPEAGSDVDLQEKTVTPTKEQQTVTPDEGYDGMSAVTVQAIPDEYKEVDPQIAYVEPTAEMQFVRPTGVNGYLVEVTVAGISAPYHDTSAVTATAERVLEGSAFVDAEGNTVDGTMADRSGEGAPAPLTVERSTYTIPEGYHDGGQAVSVAASMAVVTPSREQQTVTGSAADDGTGNLSETGYLSRVTVEAIPDKYQDTSGVTATAERVLEGSAFVDAEGNTVAGAMADRGAVSAKLNRTKTEYTVPAGYHSGAGKVSAVVENKVITPTKGVQLVRGTNDALLGLVTVYPIPDQYVDVSDSTVTPETLSEGEIAYDASGEKITGTDRGYDAGKADGERSEYDRFWDAYQMGGSRTQYEGGFAGYGWNAETLKPKYDIVPTTAQKIFDHCAEQSPFDLQAQLDAAGVVLDFSRCTNFTQCFLWSGITRVGVVDTRAASNLSSLFYYDMNLETVDRLILKSDAAQVLGNNMFAGCSSLVKLGIEGIIANGIGFGDCTRLSRESIESIIGCLSDASSGLTVTFSLTAVKNAFETSAGAADGNTSPAWTALVAAKPNWSVSLV